ncbi:MAG: phage holin family protein, partial [Pantoea sp.]|uniref:phage holin family protein n=1 Tax=Pantoea sp. TaxID=69393 RepID=UPI001D82AF4A
SSQLQGRSQEILFIQQSLDWPRTATIAIGGSVGFIGVDSLRTFVLRFIGNRIGVKDDSERGPGHTK